MTDCVIGKTVSSLSDGTFTDLFPSEQNFKDGKTSSFCGGNDQERLLITK